MQALTNPLNDLTNLEIIRRDALVKVYTLLLALSLKEETASTDTFGREADEAGAPTDDVDAEKFYHA